MLKQLLKRIEQREFSVEQEERLNAEMLEAQQLIEENKRLRALEDSVRIEINKDEEKVKKFNEIDAKIGILEKDKKRIELVGAVLAILLSLVALVTSVGLTILGAKLFTNIVWQLLLPLISIPVTFAAGCPSVKFISKQAGKVESAISSLYAEKTFLLNELYKTVEQKYVAQHKEYSLPIIQRCKLTKTGVVYDSSINI